MALISNGMRPKSWLRMALISNRMRPKSCLHIALISNGMRPKSCLRMALFSNRIRPSLVLRPMGCGLTLKQSEAKVLSSGQWGVAIISNWMSVLNNSSICVICAEVTLCSWWDINPFTAPRASYDVTGKVFSIYLQDTVRLPHWLLSFHVFSRHTKFPEH